MPSHGRRIRPLRRRSLRSVSRNDSNRSRAIPKRRLTQRDARPFG